MSDPTAIAKTSQSNPDNHKCPVCGGELDDGGLVVDPAAGLVALHGRSVSLTPREMSFFEILARRPGSAVALGYIVEQFYDYGAYEPDDPLNAIRVYVTKVRRKTSPLNLEIKSVWGTGYRLVIHPQFKTSEGVPRMPHEFDGQQKDVSHRVFTMTSENALNEMADPVGDPVTHGAAVCSGLYEALLAAIHGTGPAQRAELAQRFGLRLTLEAQRLAGRPLPREIMSLAEARHMLEKSEAA